MTSAIIYLHGFLSAGNAVKARTFRSFMEQTRPEVTVLSPDIDNDPLKAFGSVMDYLKDKPRPQGVIGSSLGGFWARMLARELQIPGVLLNPVVHADSLIRERLGEYQNPATGVRFCLTEDTVRGICGAEADADELDRRLLRVYLGTADEVLDHRVALDFFKGCDVRLLPGETHRLFGFEALCPEIADYLLSGSAGSSGN